jgi:hypothetical protein
MWEEKKEYYKSTKQLLVYYRVDFPLSCLQESWVFALFFVFSRSPGCADLFNNLNYYKRAQLLRQLHEFNDGWLVSASTGGKQQASKRASERASSSFSRWQGRAIRESIEAEEDGS